MSIYSFADSRREEMIDELRRQSDDPNHPLTDWDFIRLMNIIRLASGMEPGNVVDATSPYAVCRVSCVGTESMPSVRLDDSPVEREQGESKSEMVTQADSDRSGCAGFVLGVLFAFFGFVFLYCSAVGLLLIAHFFNR